MEFRNLKRKTGCWRRTAAVTAASAAAGYRRMQYPPLPHNAYMDKELYRAILFDKIDINEGMIMENAIAQ